MINPSCPIIVLSGAGGGAPNLAALTGSPEDANRFKTIGYPGWQRYVAGGFSAESFISELTAQIATQVPRGPICIVGLSIGGHFGYAAALRLQASGREIAGLCAIDTFMIASAKPSAGWKGRALAQGWELMRKRRIGELMLFMRSKFWRALLRFSGNRLPSLVQRFALFHRLPSVSILDPMLEEELSMRLLIREVAPWIASLDREPTALEAPATLLRTAFTAGDDAAWRRRCPNIEIFEISGQHHTLFEPENIASLREAFVTATRAWH
jgi:thioesterase domain-containing protein